MAITLHPNPVYEEDFNQTLEVDSLHEEPQPPKKSERALWSNKIEFFLSCLGCAVGLGNVWRFPYLCYRNGGGAFLIPYIFMVLVMGLPIAFLHLSIGQYTSNGPLTCWEYAPIFKGMGLGRAIVAGYVAITYNMIIAWALYFFFSSWTSYLPWTDCDNPWNTYQCSMSVNNSSNLTIDGNQSHQRLVLPSEEFYENHFLQISDGIGNPGKPVWYIVLGLLGAYILVSSALVKGVKSIGKVQYFTALFPYVILTTLLIRGALLPNSADGIRYYIVPDWSRLADVRVWYDAAMQVFFSYALNTGEFVTLSSYNPFHNNVQRDVVRIACCNSGTSIFAGFVVFSYLGYMAAELGVPIDKVANSGAGFAFIVYPTAVTLLPISPLWSVLFFAMLLSLGFGSDFVIIENIVTTIVDMRPKLKPRKLYVLLAVCLTCFTIGLSMTTQGGVYVLQLIDTYGTGWTSLLIAFCEIISISWIYGYERFSKDIQCMIGYRPFLFWKVTWTFVSPVTILSMMVFSWANFSLARYGDYIYPDWANGVGWVLTLSPALLSLIYTVWRIGQQKGTIWERVRNLSRPSELWGPRLRENRLLASRFNPDIQIDTKNEPYE